ncbi:MAG: LysM peptidoglycan-binding domain-containing protein [Actinobacteria bacterium]|nr:MAG: LysM peptidoglycan-binding domain-containing protein [Actinomycetota bacterium]
MSRHTVPSHPRALPAAGRYYAVQPGDTLGRIAGRFRTTVERLLALNPGVQPTALHAGQRLRVG